MYYRKSTALERERELHFSMDKLIGMDNALSNHLEHLLPIRSCILCLWASSFLLEVGYLVSAVLYCIGTCEYKIFLSMGPSVNLSEGV